MEDLRRKVRRKNNLDVIDKAALMEEHRKELGNKYIYMMVDMEVEDIEAKLAELREMTAGTEDQKTLAVLSLMWMVERRKEEQWEEQKDKERGEAEQREVHGKKEMEQTEREQGDCEKTNMQEQEGKREELEVLMDSRFRKSGGPGTIGKGRRQECGGRGKTRRKGERTGGGKKRMKDIWRKWEDRQRLEGERRRNCRSYSAV